MDLQKLIDTMNENSAKERGNEKMKKVIDDLVMKPGFYSIVYHCSNCGESYTQFFPKGERASQGECSNCGCMPDVERRSDYEHKLY